VFSSLGLGTRFTINLPAYKEEDKTAQPKAAMVAE